MRKTCLILLLLFSYSFIAYSQSTNVIKYLGLIRVDEVGAFTYQVNMKVDGNLITGTTVTTTGPKQETTAGLKGEILNKGKQIRLVEGRIIQTNFKDKKTTFCFVNTTLNKKTTGKMEVLEGKFVGKDEQGNTCATGKIYLVRKSAIMADSVEVGQILQQVQDTLAKVKKEAAQITILNTNTINKIICKSDKVKVRFYDGGIEDFDQIDVNYNNKKILDQYTLKTSGKSFELEITKDQPNLITVKTLNIGNSGLNTVDIDITVAPFQIKTYRLEVAANTLIQIQLVN